MFNLLVLLVVCYLFIELTCFLFRKWSRASNRAKALREVDNPLTWCREMGDVVNESLRSAYLLDDLKHARSLLRATKLNIRRRDGSWQGSKTKWSQSHDRMEAVDLLSYVQAAAKTMGNPPEVMQRIAEVESLFASEEAGEITQDQFELARQILFESVFLSLVAIKEIQTEEETPNPNELP